MGFTPNRLSFEAGLERIAHATAVLGDFRQKIRTSRDDDMPTVLNGLKTDNVPSGFTKWQLPFSFERCQVFISAAGPHARVPEHAHDGDGVRIIMSGSIRYNGRELAAGDWMYIPKGKPYQFEVGALGATMCYCYECCCA